MSDDLDDLMEDTPVSTRIADDDVPEAFARALWFASPRTAEIRVEALPAPNHGEVRVRAEVSAISQGTEMLVYRGLVAGDTDLDLPTFAGSFALPIKYGYASVGRVTARGAGVAGLTVGDRVFVLHPHQTEYVVPAELVWRLPRDLSPQAAAFAANVETALNVLLDAPLRLGETAVIFGQGVVGLLLTQLLRRAGAGKVVVVEPYPLRRGLALRLGADVALAPEEATPARLRALTAGRGADVAYEASGAPAALQAAVDAVAQQGLVAAVSWYGTRPVTLDLGRAFHRGRVRLLSSQVGSIDPSLAPRWDYARRRQTVLDLLPQLSLSELVTHRFPFESAPEAYRLLEEHPEETVQVLFTYAPSRDVGLAG
ncbi:MAG: zinc-binding dehydrogenase [Chloroflexota bacterium]